MRFCILYEPNCHNGNHLLQLQGQTEVTIKWKAENYDKSSNVSKRNNITFEAFFIPSGRKMVRFVGYLFWQHHFVHYAMMLNIFSAQIDSEIRSKFEIQS